MPVIPVRLQPVLLSHTRRQFSFPTNFSTFLNAQPHKPEATELKKQCSLSLFPPTFWSLWLWVGVVLPSRATVPFRPTTFFISISHPHFPAGICHLWLQQHWHRKVWRSPWDQVQNEWAGPQLQSEMEHGQYSHHRNQCGGPGGVKQIRYWTF